MIVKSVKSVLTGIGLLLCSGAALATTTNPQPIIFFRPAATPSIPTLDETMLLALGILLLVVALRFIRARRGTVMTLTGAALLSGLLLGGYGLEKSIATGELTISGNECQLPGQQGFDGTRLAYLQSNCSNHIEVSDIQQCVSPEYIDPEPGCRVGTVIAPDERCNMPRCDRGL